VLVATITNKVTTSLFSKPEIKTVEELKGKIIATGRPGAFLGAMVRYVLREGNEKVQNVQIVQVVSKDFRV
jgi:ABC-type nitrate/sulfonate/bicarbonate transport system substrate-binding protein